MCIWQAIDRDLVEAAEAENIQILVGSRALTGTTTRTNSSSNKSDRKSPSYNINPSLVVADMNELMTRPSTGSGKDSKGGMRRIAVSSDGVSSYSLTTKYSISNYFNLYINYVLHNIYAYTDSYFTPHWL